MDPVLLARLQFAFTIAFHFIFPSITMGLSWLNVWFMTKYLRSKDPNDKAVAKFWIKIFTISFAVGVATGIVMALQFGTNWASYSRIVGDVFGAPLAAEAIFAFFLESTFLGVLIFGWEKLSLRILWLASIFVAIGTLISAFWIIVANSWMQTPDGYKLIFDTNDTLIKAELVDFWAAVFNPSTIVRFLHTYSASLLVAAFFIFGVNSWYLLKGKNVNLSRQTLKLSISIILISTIALAIVGHIHTGQISEFQPEKFATYEVIENTTTQETLPILVILNPFTEEIILRINLPFINLGMFLFLDSSKEFKGWNSFLETDLPPRTLTMYPFHLMIALGIFFLIFGIIGLYLITSRKIVENNIISKNYLKIAVLSIPLPFIALQLGWMAAEVGRQPWAVYGILKTTDGISVNVPAEQILFSLVMFTIIYFFLFVFWIILLIREIQIGPKVQTNVLSEGSE